MRWMLFFDGRSAKRALPIVGEYIRPNVKPRKSNSPSGTLQMRVFSSFTVSFRLVPRRPNGIKRGYCRVTHLGPKPAPKLFWIAADRRGHGED